MWIYTTFFLANVRGDIHYLESNITNTIILKREKKIPE